MPTMPSPASALGRVILGGSIAVGLYAVTLGLLLTPAVQRFALYANIFNTAFIDNLNDPRKYGFAKNQVVPFNIHTPDGEKLYAWHILPVDAYVRHEDKLRHDVPADGPILDITQSTGFQILSNQTEYARVVISCECRLYMVDKNISANVVVGKEVHGNAGHVAQGYRAETFRYLTSLPNTHVLTVDYRGFGHSTGAPTEAGLVTDGTALVNWALQVAKIPPERIVILGQSLGTAVASAVALRYVDPQNILIPAESKQLVFHTEDLTKKTPIAFAGVVLVAPFFSLPSLMLTYRMGGILPILLPLRPFPDLAGALTSRMIDQWPTGERLSAYSRTLSGSTSLRSDTGQKMATLQFVHALNDLDISFHQTAKICTALQDYHEACDLGNNGSDVLEFKREGEVQSRYEILQYGGHNRITTYTAVMGAIERAFNGLFL